MSIYSLNETKRLLFQSCKDGSSGTVQQLLTQHSDLRAQINSLIDDDGNTALIIASESGHTGIVKLLLKYYGASVDHRNSRGWTALMKASEKGDSKLEIIELLLKHGAQVDLQNDDGECALIMAAQNNQAKVATILVQEYGASVGLKQKHSSRTALMEASESGSIDIVKLLLDHGADDLGWALVQAILKKHVLLLETGAQVDDKNWSLLLDQPPLIAAVETGDVNIVKLLLEHGAKQGIDWAVTDTILSKNAEIIKMLSGRGAQVDEFEDRFGLPPLMIAVGKGDADIVRLLLEHGAKQGIGRAMTYAILSKNAEIIKMLSEHGAQVDEDRFYPPPLLQAVEKGDADIVKLLLEHGAKQGIGWAMTNAIFSKNAEITKMLSEFGAQVDDDGFDLPPLVKAVEKGDADIYNDDIIAFFAADSDNKTDALESEGDSYEEVQLTQEEEAHLLAIENAITETGTLDHTLVHGVFVGPPRSGKDSIMKRLLGEVVPNTSPSTGAVETAIHVKVEESCTYAATIGQSNWTRLEYDEEALHLMKTTSNSSSATCPIEGEESTDTQIADPPSAVKESTSKNFDNPQNKTVHIQTENTLEVQPEIDPQPVPFQDETSFQINKSEQTQQKSKHKTPIEIFKEAIKKKGLEGLRKLLTNSWSLYLTNTGGQMEFQELLPLLVSGPSMFFITFQLHKDLNECFQVEYELPSGESSKCYESSLSILDSILQTLSTISAMGTFVYKGLQKKCVPLIQKPKVFLIGTHKDLLDKKSAPTIIDRIDAKLQTVIKSTSHYREGIIQFASESRMIFTVNNLDPSDSDFQTIRSAVERTVEKGDYKMRSPAHWMIYSLVVRQLQTRVESYDECFAIAKECGIKDKNEFNEALHFIHTKMGLVRYFPHEELKDIVIVDPQILFEKVTELIVETFTFENLPNRSKLEAFKRMGIFDLSDFTNISRRAGQKLTPTLFAKLLEYLRIAARFQQGGETKYFLPCALTHAQVKQNVYNSTIPQLIATFQCGYCPKGLFGTLITFLINNEMQSDIEWELDTENIYRDEVCFHVGPYDTVTIRFMPTHLQISCAESNPDLPRINCAQEDVCQEVRESVEKGIKTVTSAINYIKAQHSFTFYCTSDVCSEDPHPSKLKEFKGKLCSLMCNKLKQCFRLPSGYEKWQLCSTTIKECHNLKERLDESFLIQQLSDCAAKWREIGTHLKFQQKKLDIIQAKPYLLSDAPRSWLSALISEWLERAPGGSASLEDLKSAVSKAGFGVIAAELSPQQEVAGGESGQSIDTGRKRTSSSAAEISSKRPRLS